MRFSEEQVAFYHELGLAITQWSVVEYRDIALARLNFVALSASLENFGCRILGIEELAPKADEQAQRAPQTAQLVRQIREALVVQSKPSLGKS